MPVHHAANGIARNARGVAFDRTASSVDGRRFTPVQKTGERAQPNVPRANGAFGAVQSVAEHCGFAPSLAQTVEYFSTGKDLYPRLLADLNGANKFILLEYYIVERGEFWNSVLAILQKKARVSAAQTQPKGSPKNRRNRRNDRLYGRH